ESKNEGKKTKGKKLAVVICRKKLQLLEFDDTDLELIQISDIMGNILNNCDDNGSNERVGESSNNASEITYY
ncbi:hypothetical protein EC973_006995, partial [Apophysomyces ossiformis]